MPASLSFDARDLIQKLLQKNPMDRIKLSEIPFHSFLRLNIGSVARGTGDSGMYTMTTGLVGSQSCDARPVISCPRTPFPATPVEAWRSQRPPVTYNLKNRCLDLPMIGERLNVDQRSRDARNVPHGSGSSPMLAGPATVENLHHSSHSVEMQYNPLSCCDSVQKHRSWCEQAKISKNLNNNFLNNLRNDSATPDFISGCKNSATNNLRTREFLGSSELVIEKKVGNISLKNDPQSNSRENYDAGNEMKPQTGKTSSSVPSSPIKTDRLRPTRQKTKNAVASIFENGEVCLEFLKDRQGEERVVDILRISGDGLRVAIYHPSRDGVAATTDGRLDLASTGADAVYGYDNLPPRHHKKYLYAARFIKLVKAKTPKITLYTKQAKCMLMENFPDPDFESLFYDGTKMTRTKKDVKVIFKGGATELFERNDLILQTKDALKHHWKHFTESEEHCKSIELLLQRLETSSLPGFPVVIGRKPPDPGGGPLREKENLAAVGSPPVAPPSRLGSFDGSICSTRTAVMARRPISRRAVVPGVGNVGQTADGDVVVDYLDGTAMVVSSTSARMSYDDGVETRVYDRANDLPNVVREKLRQLPVVIESLRSSGSSKPSSVYSNPRLFQRSTSIR